MTSLRDTLRAIPDVEVAHSPAVLAGIEDSVRYLASDEAFASLAQDPYWPKWHSPWWHMTALWELGEAHRIPARAVEAMVAAIDRMPVHAFPIRPEDLPPGCDPSRDFMCHCAVGTIDQVLTACGVDVAARLPWFSTWFERYQMSDGGLNCDETAYAASECASSMVGTIALFEAGRAPRHVIDRAARFLIDRELRLGSPSVHNAEERTTAPSWLAPTFPRFYFYDVLRGLAALARWDGELPARAIEAVVGELAHRFPDGIVRVERQAFAGRGTRARDADGTWRRQPAATSFPLLDAVSTLGAPNRALTAAWRTTRHALLARDLTPA